jgi:hypothetical protein
MEMTDLNHSCEHLDTVSEDHSLVVFTLQSLSSIDWRALTRQHW